MLKVIHENLSILHLYHLQFLIRNNRDCSRKKVAPTSQELYIEIAAMDKELFDAFNAKDMSKFKPHVYRRLRMVPRQWWFIVV